MPLLYYITLAVIVLSFISSLVSFRLDYPVHLKLFSVLLGATVLDEVGALIIRMRLHQSTGPWYNCFMGLECWIFVYYYSFILNSPKLKAFIKGFLWLYPLFWVATVFFVFGLYVWNSYVAAMECFITVFLSICYYYQLLTAKRLVVLKNSPEFWIATGLIICYSCNLPYIGVFNFLNKNLKDLSAKLIPVLQILNILMYSIFTYAFLCRINTKKLL